MKRSRTPALAASLTIALLTALIGLLYLTFVLPRHVAACNEAGTELCTGLVCLVNVGRCCQHCGWLLLPALLLGFVASAVWWIVSICREH